jgi:DNA-directed RNA polymerase subunit beta'
MTRSQKIKDSSSGSSSSRAPRLENRPEWMVLDVIPVIPPDLRPLVLLESGNFATSDLNDLYRRLINRNNRLKKLLDLNAPEVIIRNEKRMLQQAVDALFDNGRCRRPVLGSSNRPLKSLTDMIKGKQGRFRENLLGKRVDYSARSVIVVGPELRSCTSAACPRRSRSSSSSRSSSALKEHRPRGHDQVGQEDARAQGRAGLGHPRGGDQGASGAAQPRADPAPHGHPGLRAGAGRGQRDPHPPAGLRGFNADFDGDQMAVHLPLSLEAQVESLTLMLSTNNIFSPAHGGPIIAPSQDIVLGCYYITISPRLEKKDEDKPVPACTDRATRLPGLRSREAAHPRAA